VVEGSLETYMNSPWVFATEMLGTTIIGVQRRADAGPLVLLPDASQEMDGG
jgi:hypothetical protein